jgi:ribonuclease P protein component
MEVGVIASKKQVSKKAVRRNCAKRRIRAALRELDAKRFEQILEEQGLTRVRILFVCSKDCLTLEFTQLIQNLNLSLLRVLLSLKHSEGGQHGSAPKSSE